MIPSFDLTALVAKYGCVIEAKYGAKQISAVHRRRIMRKLGAKNSVNLVRTVMNTVRQTGSLIRGAEFSETFEDNSSSSTLYPARQILISFNVRCALCNDPQLEVAFLRAYRCDEAQGYYFSRPVPAQQFEVLLRNGTRGHEVVA
jgi:hypothetical protein